MGRKIENKPVEGKPATKNDLKREQTKRKVYNNKHKTAPSTLTVRDGGAANEKGGSINNAFFNKAMGGSVSAADLTPSSTGFAADGGSAGIGAAGGDGGACGESLQNEEINAFMGNSDYLNYLKAELTHCNDFINDESADKDLKKFYSNRANELEKEISKVEKDLEKDIITEAAENVSTKEQLQNIFKAIPSSDKTTWKDTAETVIDNLSDKDINTLADTVRTMAADVNLGSKAKATVSSIADADLREKLDKINFSTVKEVFDFLSGEDFLNKHPDKVKPFIVAVLGVIAIIEPTVVGEIITAVVLALPEDVLVKILKAISMLNPIKLIINALAAKEQKKEESLNESVSEDLFFRAYITNLGKYNEGELEGKYVEFPMSEDEFNAELESIGIGSTDEFGQPYEEWFVTDYDTNTGISLGEYVSYEELNNIGEVIEEINKYHLQEAFTNAVEVCDGEPEDIAQAVIDGDIVYMDDVTSDSDLGYAIIDEFGGVEDALGDRISYYIDEEAMRRDYECDVRDSMIDDAKYELTRQKHTDDISEDEIEEWIDDNIDSYLDTIIADEIYMAEKGEIDLSNYFDYEAFGRDCRLEGNFEFTRNGCIEDRR